MRLAPQPWGNLHLGGLRVALVNHAFSLATGGTLFLRIDDTQPHPGQRAFEEATRALLRRFGLDVVDPGPPVGVPFRQSGRHGVYRERALALVRAGRAYRCDCPPREARAAPRAGGCACRSRDVAAPCVHGGPGGAVIRLRTDPSRVYRYRDLIYGEVAGRISRDPALVRSDGRGLYAFASVVDDIHLGITHVIRGEDHRDATLAQLAMWEALGAQPPRFAHVPLVLDARGRKLSKSKRFTAVADFLRAGYLPGAIVTALRRSGPPGWWEGLCGAGSVEEAEAALGRLGRRPTHVSRAALGSAQRDALRSLGWQAAGAHLRGWVSDTGALAAGAWAGGAGGADPFADRQVVEALLSRSRRMGDVLRLTLGWRLPPPAQRLPGEVRALLRRVLARRRLPGAGEPWKESIVEAARESGVPGAQALRRVRQAWTGAPTGPPIGLVARALGEAECARRLRAALGKPRARALPRALARTDLRRAERYIARRRGFGDARVVRTHAARRGPVYELEADSGRERYFVKGLGGGLDLAGLAVEARCLLLLGPLGLSATQPRLDAGRLAIPFPVLSYRALEGERLEPRALRESRTLAEAARALRRLHEVEPPRDGALPADSAAGTLGGWRSLLESLRRVLARTAGEGRAETALHAALADVVLGLGPALERFVDAHGGEPAGVEDLVLSHGDPRAQNMVRTGDGLGLLDLEGARLSDPASDLAWLLELSELPADADRVAVSAYAAGRPQRDRDALQARLSLRRRLVRLLWPLRLLAVHLETGRERRAEIAWRLARGLRAFPGLAGPWVQASASEIARALWPRAR
jgi:glutamyl-tRNA synthetase